MDYPKSVPSVGLVGGKFVDEDPGAGTPGSLIPSAWGNAVTLEILGVIEAAGFVPDEENNAQLAAAISGLIEAATPNASETVSGKARIATQAEVFAGTDNAKIVTALKLAQRLAVCSPVVGSLRNGRMSVPTASASGTFTADELFVQTALGGAGYKLSGFNKVVNLAAAGAGGMDTGAAPNNGYVAIYAVYNPITATSALLAVNATVAKAPEVYGGANMPAGYTASALVSVWPTNGSGQLQVGIQRGRRVSRPPINVLNTSVASPTPTTLSISSGVPANAVACRGSVGIISAAGSNNATLICADSNSIGGQFNVGNPGTQMSGTWGIQLISNQTLFYQMTATATPANYTISISEYEF